VSDLSFRLHVLGLLAIHDKLDDIVALATQKRWGPRQLLEHIAELEESDRGKRSLDGRLARSRLGKFKAIADFDWAWPTVIDRPLVEHALDLGFMENNRNIVLVASQGLGKTTIAQNIGHRAILAGHSVLFVTAAQLLLDLAAQESARALENRLRYYAKVSLLVVDEVGYLAFDSRNADLFFQIVSRRYEKKSLVLTTNLAFRDWPTIFPNAACATALIDRVVHHADIIAIEGESYRLRDAKSASRERDGRTPTAQRSRKKK
jgi:DNA replication protein DnaC